MLDVRRGSTLEKAYGIMPSHRKDTCFPSPVTDEAEKGAGAAAAWLVQVEEPAGQGEQAWLVMLNVCCPSRCSFVTV